MKIISADITGSLIINNQDVTTTVESSSIWSGSIASRVTDLEQFSSSLDATFATDQQLNQATASLSSSIAILSGSYLTTSQSYEVVSGSYSAASSSLSIRVTNNESTGSILTTASASFSVVSSSFVEVSSSYSSASGSLSTRVTTLEAASSSFNTASGSFSTRVTNIEGNYATTGSNVFLGAQTICANITSTGTITAQTINVQQVTSSIVYSCGSNIFGCSTSDVQQFTGSVRITGSLNTIGNACVTSICSPSIIGGTFSGTTISGTTLYGSTAVCAPNLCATTTICGPAFIGGTVSGTTIYGSTVVCSPSVLSSGTICSTGNTCFGGMSIIASCLGIGTATPDSLLHVLNCSNIPYSDANTLASGQWFRVSNPSTCTGANAGIIFVAQGPSGGNGLATINGVTTSCGSMAITFATRNASGNVTERMRITSAGIACFSGTVCASSFSGAGTGLTGTASSLSIGGTAANATNASYASTAGSAAAVPWSGIIAGTRTNYTLKFQPPSEDFSGFEFTGTNGSGAGYFLIRGTSDTGVYTAEGITLVADQGWATIAQRTTSDKGVRIMTGASSSTRICVLASGETLFNSNICVTGALSMATSGTNYIRMGVFPYAVTNSGEAWIGRASDRNAGTMTVQLGGNSASNRQFEVVDYAWSVVLASVSSGGTFSASGDVIAYASDCRLKQNVVPITNALGKIKCINGVSYTWKDGTECLGFTPTSKQDVGVLAQEIQKVLPEVVKPAPFDQMNGESKSGENYLTVKYEKIVPLLIEAIKEQQCQIDYLKSKIG